MTNVIGFAMYHLGWLGFLFCALLPFVADTNSQIWFGIVMAIIFFVIYIAGYIMKEA